MYYKAYGNNSLFALSWSCDAKASISYERWKIMATVVKILKQQPESDWIYHVTLSRRILFSQKLNLHMYM